MNLDRDIVHLNVALNLFRRRRIRKRNLNPTVLASNEEVPFPRFDTAHGDHACSAAFVARPLC